PRGRRAPDAGGRVGPSACAGPSRNGRSSRRRTYHVPVAVQLGRLELETPDHVILRYDLAGGGNRGFAALVDAVIASLVVAGSLFVTSYAVRFLGLARLPLSALISLIARLLASCSFALLDFVGK